MLLGQVDLIAGTALVGTTVTKAMIATLSTRHSRATIQISVAIAQNENVSLAHTVLPGSLIRVVVG